MERGSRVRRATSSRVSRAVGPLNASRISVIRSIIDGGDSRRAVDMTSGAVRAPGLVMASGVAASGIVASVIAPPRT
ncbi:hypothetical protein GCM10023088_43840 [Actinomadura verrucosospora]